MRREDPARLDSLIRYSAGAYRRKLKGGPHKWGAQAHAISRSRYTRYTQGDPHAPLTKRLAELYQTAKSDKTKAWSEISEEIAVINQAQVEEATTDALLARFRELTGDEHRIEGEQNRAMFAPDAEESAAALLAHAETLMEIAAIRRELEVRRVPYADLTGQ